MIEIRVERLTKKFGPVVALDDINFTVNPGEIFFLLGPSGCGKTTLLRNLAGFYTPSSGHIFFGGNEVTEQPPHKRKTGMVFQNYALWPHMTVAENVGFGLQQLKVPKKEAQVRVEEALKSVQMESYKARKPAELSGGQQQRVALARALVIRPRCLLMDEPLSNLDAQLRYYMRLEIQRICKDFGLTTVYVTHDQKEALSIADKVAVLSNGKIQQIGTPQTVYKRPRNQFVAEFIGATNIIKGTILHAGAGEALVDTPIGKFQGVFANPESEAKEGDHINISIRPEAFKLMDDPVDENCLSGSIRRAMYYGEVAHYRFFTGSQDTKDKRLKISELNPCHMSERDRDNLYACVDPQDVVILED